MPKNGLEKEKELSNSKDSMVTFLMLPKLAFKDLPKRYYNVVDTEGYNFKKKSPKAAKPLWEIFFKI